MKNMAKALMRKQLARWNRKMVPLDYHPAREVQHLGRKHHLNIYANKYTNDFTRVSLLDLAIDEIKTKDITGDLAELGVYKGHFASLLNQSFPDRDLYLFDTFEGFSKEEEAHDMKNYGMDYQRDFTDTSLESVMSIMPEASRCIARKGLFPDTAKGLEDKSFAFVSIDTDLYLPIKSGLEFFYDRMSPGGFIFVHDYNNATFPGARQAVNEFSAARGVPFVPVCDWFGSVIFRKNG